MALAVQRAAWLCCWLVAAALSLAEGVRTGEGAQAALALQLAAEPGADLSFECVHANAKLSSSTIGALLVRGGPYLGGGFNLIERDAAGVPSLERFMAVEPWLEITNASCMDDLFWGAFANDEAITTATPPSSSRPPSGLDVYTLQQQFPFANGNSVDLGPKFFTSNPAFKYPGHGMHEAIKKIEAKMAPLNGGRGNYTYRYSSYLIGYFDFVRRSSTPCARLARPFLSELKALPMKFSVATTPAYTAFARRFGLWVASRVYIGRDEVTYSNGRDTVVLHGMGIMNYTGEACVNPPLSSILYDGIGVVLYPLVDSGFIADDLPGGDARLDNLQDASNIAAMVRYDKKHATAAPVGVPTAAPTPPAPTPTSPAPTTGAPTFPTPTTGAPTSLPPTPTSLPPTTAAPINSPTPPTPDRTAIPMSSPPTRTPVITLEFVGGSAAPSSADVLRTHTSVLTIALYVGAMVY